jgi:peptidoglycan/LPS O-acetylase OafA/YrhL
VTKGTSIQVVPALDGLRGVAILLVILLHFDLLSVGWVGVQLFFVLSGFLICSNLLLTRETYSSASQVLRLFYWKRALRIFPLYYCVLFFYFLLQRTPVFPLLYPGEALAGWKAFTANFFYLGNFVYFGALPEEAKIKLLAHFWSLAVEEQFYLVFPWLVAFLNKRTVFKIALASLVVCPVLRSFLEEANKNALCQFDAFGIGICLCFVWRDPAARAFLAGRKAITTAALGLGVMVTFVAVIFLLWKIQLMGIRTAHTSFGFDPDGLFHKHVWVFSLFNLLSAMAVLACLQLPHFPLLSSAPLRFVGKISYGLYVLHYPVAQALGLARDRWSISAKSGMGIALFVASLFCLVALAQLSYRCLELPFLRLKDRYKPRAES